MPDSDPSLHASDAAANARRDAAVHRANDYYHQAGQMRRIAARCKTPGPWLDVAATFDAMAQFIVLCWKESRRC